jgi:hypothetical protein
LSQRLDHREQTSFIRHRETYESLTVGSVFTTFVGHDVRVAIKCDNERGDSFINPSVHGDRTCSMSIHWLIN